MKFRPSITKDWPGGRRLSKTLQSIPFEGTAMLWNKESVCSLTRPYLPIKPEPVVSSPDTSLTNSVLTDSVLISD